MATFIGYDVRSPVGVSKAIRTKAIEKGRPCTLQHNFSLRRGFL
ncbi:hypothetical protein [Microcoleus sp. D3_18_C2]